MQCEGPFEPPRGVRASGPRLDPLFAVHPRDHAIRQQEPLPLSDFAYGLSMVHTRGSCGGSAGVPLGSKAMTNPSEPRRGNRRELFLAAELSLVVGYALVEAIMHDIYSAVVLCSVVLLAAWTAVFVRFRR